MGVVHSYSITQDIICTRCVGKGAGVAGHHLVIRVNVNLRGCLVTVNDNVGHRFFISVVKIKCWFYLP